MTEKTLHDAVLEHLEFLKGQGKSERTLYTYSKDLEQVEAFFGPDKKLSAILIPHVAGFLKSDALLKMSGDEDRSEITVKKTIRVFRTFLVWAKEQDYVTKLPLPKDTPMGRSLKSEPEVANAEPPATA
jgi:site-specific recombinase XerD